MSTTSQIFKLIDHMTYIGPITAKEAMDTYAIGRLSARIKDIRDRGYPVKTVMIATHNRFGETVRVGQYSLSNPTPKETKTNERT